MVFSSIIFLFLFLPASLFFYYIAGRFFRNTLLLLASLFFYAWGEQFYVLVMLASIGLNYLVGLLLNREGLHGFRQSILWGGVAANLGMLIFFKYSYFFFESITPLLTFAGFNAVVHSPPHLPIGISFFTFQALSYIIDVYKQTTTVQRNVFSLGLYIASFPQLIAGPIVRYHDVARQIAERSHSVELFSKGVERFVFGLSKKVLIANPMGEMADAIFLLDASTLSTGTAWLGILCYSLQIYFDFSGYSDMAIGLGRMFGFHFLENFNYPYVSRSIKEFWRRWHISLSNWFRDYLYIPLGGNRRGKYRTAANLVLVFLLCGLWHGANWNFLLWGLIYGCFLVAERGKFGTVLKALPRWIQHGYVLLVVVNTWVFFRIDTVKGIGKYLAAMYGNADAQSIYPLIAIRIDLLFVITLSMGILFSMPTYPYIRDTVSTVGGRFRGAEVLFAAAKLVVLGILFFWSAAQLAVGSYNPFIYFRF